MTTQLNLPVWKATSKAVDRVAAAKAKAYKTAADLVKSIPDASADAELLHQTMNKMLSAGTIKSLEEFYELTGTGNPTPTKAEKEASLNSSGYTVVDGSNFFKLYSGIDYSTEEYTNYGSNTLSSNVEAIRMLYNAGMSIASIREKLSSMKEGDVLSLKCKKVLKRFPKSTYEELLNKYPDFRAYPEYLTTKDRATYAVCDELGGNDSVFILYIKQDLNDTAILSCNDIEFPVKGTLVINVNDKDYSFSIDAVDSYSLIAQLDKVKSPMSFYYENGLVLKSKFPFYFPSSNDNSILDVLGIKDALLKAKESFYLGYTGISLREDSVSPYNIVVKKSGYSRSNIRKIYNSLKSAGISEDICKSYLLGKSLYSKADESLNNLRDVVAKHPYNYELIKAYEDDYFRKTNVRILGTTTQTIDRLFKLSDSSLEYLLRYRTDIVSIDPYCSNEEAKESILKKATASSGNSYHKEEHSDTWKARTSHSRTSEFYVKTTGNYVNQSNNSYEEWIADTQDFLETEVSVSYSYQDVRSSETLGMALATSVNWEASASFAHGLQCFKDIRQELDTSFLDEFEEDMLIIQGYLDAAFSAFQGVCAQIASIIKIITSSLNLSLDTGGSFGLDGGSLLQCSLSVDLGLNIPLYIPKLNEIMIGLLEMLEAAFQAVIGLENSILCPIQNLLDKYVNTKNFSLPCKINYSVPVISGIDAYLKGYLNALGELKMMCNITKKDANWMKFNASMMPGSLELLVTKSTDCKES